MKPKPSSIPPSRVPRGEKDFPPVAATERGGNEPGRESRGIKYGSYIADLIEKDEFPVFDDFWNKLNESFELNDSSDRISAELACVYYVRLQRAIKAGAEESIRNMDGLMRGQLNMLKVTRISREGATLNFAANTSPAEWATALLEKAKGDGKRPQKAASAAGKKDSKEVKK